MPLVTVSLVTMPAPIPALTSNGTRYPETCTLRSNSAAHVAFLPSHVNRRLSLPLSLTHTHTHTHARTHTHTYLVFPVCFGAHNQSRCVVVVLVIAAKHPPGTRPVPKCQCSLGCISTCKSFGMTCCGGAGGGCNCAPASSCPDCQKKMIPYVLWHVPM